LRALVPASLDSSSVTDFRIYRLAWLAPLVAFVVLMFSFESVPEPLSAPALPTEIDAELAETSAREIVDAGREREPGSDGDEAAADFVAERFGAVGGGIVSEQTFESDFEGSEVSLRNVILTLPSESDRTIVVLAPRDSTRPDGAVSSASATGVLLALADYLGNNEHTKQIVLVSTDGASEGAAGARELAREGVDAELVDAVVVIGPAAAAAPDGRPVVRSSTGRDSASMQLVRTAQLAVGEQAGLDSPLEGTFEELVRLALPSGLGEQAVLIDEGLDAVAISSTGERLPRADDDTLADLDPETLAELGNAALAEVLALDGTEEPPEHGPGTYVHFAGAEQPLDEGGRLIPGWAIALLALALVAPAAITAIDAIARVARRRAGAIPALRWAALLPVPLLAGLGVLYVLSVAGLVPHPAYPYDPERFGFDAAAALAAVVIATTVATGYVATGIWRPPMLAVEVLAPALGVVAIAAVTFVWVLNPFLALLIVPIAHAWVLAAREGPRTGPVVAAAVLSVVPVALAFAVVAGALDFGLEAPWQFLLMVSGGQIGPATAFCLCLCLASLAGLGWATAGRRLDKMLP
jgi:hypothetical protein